MADLSKVFDQFANTANEGEAAVLSKKKVKRALKVMFHNICKIGNQKIYSLFV
jgi:hypothetical protein